MIKIRVGITMGDPSGVGPSIILKALNDLSPAVHPVIIGDEWVLRRAAKALACRLPSREIVDLSNVNRKSFVFGALKAEYGRAGMEYLDKALTMVKQGGLDCLVTSPVSKEAVALSGLASFQGQTEYIAGKTGTRNYEMLLFNKSLRFVLITRHMPLKGVWRAITAARVIRAGKLVHSCMRSLFALKKPRFIVCGLNPHASDNGLIGTEENRRIRPAVISLRHSGMMIDGPVSADAAILQAYRGNYDCVIAMYHDQALIPLKLTDFASGVNMTIGLPFVRTSVLHGTAFDIAAHPLAVDARSLTAAVAAAVQCTQNQKKA